MNVDLLLSIAHLVGFGIGLGGATVSDVLFFRAIKKKSMTEGEVQTLGAISRLIWIGLAILIVSGVSMFAMVYAERGSLPMLASVKWQAKLTMVAVVLLNGFLFQAFVFPLLKRNTGMPLSIGGLKSGAWILALTGAVSIVSWYSILIVSSFPRGFAWPPYSVVMGIYAAAVLGALLVARFMLGRALR